MNMKPLREEWPEWPIAIKNPDIEHLHTRQPLKDNLFVYRTGIYYGLCTKEEKLTAASYVDAFKLAGDLCIVGSVFHRDYHNNQVLLDAKTGELLLDYFAAWRVHCEKNHIAYRVDGPNNEMKWGVYDMAHKKNYPAIYSSTEEAFAAVLLGK